MIGIVFRVTVATTGDHLLQECVGIDLVNAFVLKSETPNPSHYLELLVEDHRFRFINIRNKVPSPAAQFEATR